MMRQPGYRKLIIMLPAATLKLLKITPLAPEKVRGILDETLFECLESYETLGDIAAIASYDPVNLVGVSRIRYLLFALESHLNEFYILTERIDVWLKRLGARLSKAAFVRESP